MGFDNNDGQPLVQPRRWATKVNFAVVLGVVAFLILGAVAMGWMRSHKDQNANDTQQKMEASH